MIERDGFTYIRWVDKFNPDFVIPFIQLPAAKYRIDMFKSSSYYYLWYPNNNQYHEIATSLNLLDKEHINKMIQTFDYLIEKEEI